MTTPVKVFIASSAEVKEEREKCNLIFKQVNSSRKEVTLETVQYEYDFVPGNNPNFGTIQDAINPLLDESDLCIFIFYSRIGENTLKEFELAKKLNKKFFVFFKTDFKPQTGKQDIEYNKLKEFKNSFNQAILYNDYSDLSDFESKLKDNLHIYLSKQFPVRERRKWMIVAAVVIISGLIILSIAKFRQPSTTNTTNIHTSGPNSPVVKSDSGGTVNINYQNEDPFKEDSTKEK